MDESEEPELKAAIAHVEQWSHSGQEERVISACTVLLHRFAEAFALYYFRAQARAARGDRDGAIEDLGQAITRNPKEPALFYFRGLWRLDAGEHSDAARDFQEAIELEEKMESSYYVESARMARAVAHVTWPILGVRDRMQQDTTERKVLSGWQNVECG
jgi:tetratricopeptide (TPR) repeat protein